MAESGKNFFFFFGAPVSCSFVMGHHIPFGKSRMMQSDFKMCGNLKTVFLLGSPTGAPSSSMVCHNRKPPLMVGLISKLCCLHLLTVWLSHYPSSLDLIVGSGSRKAALGGCRFNLL